jgi:DnaK suppressor protein
MLDAAALPALLPHYRQRLARHEAELIALLRQASAITPDTDDVMDFKVLAQESAQAAVDQAQAAHALSALRDVAAARRRMDAGRYGLCEECGEPIDPRRLEALPASPLCADCQQVHEHPARRVA